MVLYFFLRSKFNQGTREFPMIDIQGIVAKYLQLIQWFSDGNEMTVIEEIGIHMRYDFWGCGFCKNHSDISPPKHLFKESFKSTPLEAMGNKCRGNMNVFA